MVTSCPEYANYHQFYLLTIQGEMMASEFTRTGAGDPQDGKNKKVRKKNPCSPGSQPPTAKELEKEIRQCVEQVIAFCTGSRNLLFFQFEKELWTQISRLGCLFCQLFLVVSHDRIDYGNYLGRRRYYARTVPVGRSIKTIFGEVCYWRIYFSKKGKDSGGFYPFDGIIGLSRDGFSPFVMKLATRLATRVSFTASVLLFEAFYDWAPAKESIQNLVLGLGRDAGRYMECAAPLEGEGDVLVIEVDGKAIATVTPQELDKRVATLRQKKRLLPAAQG